MPIKDGRRSAGKFPAVWVADQENPTPGRTNEKAASSAAHSDASAVRKRDGRDKTQIR